jgi:Sec-independent protein translocase protein TatA
MPTPQQFQPFAPIADQPKKKRSCLKICLYAFVVLMILGIVGRILETPEQKAEREVREKQSRIQREADRAEREKERAEREAERAEREKEKKIEADIAADRNVRFGESSPPEEKKLIEAVIAGYEEFKKGSNEIQQEKARDSRKAAIASALGTTTASNWTGTVKNIGTNSDGLGILDITISSDPTITVSTWDNALSDIFDNTLIPKSSPVYEAMANLKKGDKVLFSGRFLRDERDSIKESSLTIAGSMRAPNFIFVFSKIEKFQ